MAKKVYPSSFEEVGEQVKTGRQQIVAGIGKSLRFIGVKRRIVSKGSYDQGRIIGRHGVESHGLAAMTLIDPPVAFCPNRVPCGPFNTSTRSISRKSACPMIG